MKALRVPPGKSVSKAPTGIIGLDEITGGGLPRDRTTLLMGGPGSGKTIFSLQFLVHGALNCGEPGIFVAFEETSERIIANAESFGWDLAKLSQKKLIFIDAKPQADMIQSGNFDLGGLLAALDAAVKATGAKRIVFDALDVLLAFLPDLAARKQQTYELHEWLLSHQLTGIITTKTDKEEATSLNKQQFGFMQFMVDCAVILNHHVVLGVSQRNLRVQKYRGSSFDENEAPFLIGASGLQVSATRTVNRQVRKVTSERVTSGIERLDTMLSGGYYRGASVLITGFPGTAKTTIAAAFAEAACERGEHTAFVSFDSDANEVIRDLASVNIRLERFVKNGCLLVASARSITGSAETYLDRIKSLAIEHAARCLVIDPISTWSQSGNDLKVHSVSELLTDWAKAHGITLVCTSNVDEASQTERGQTLQIFTLADTWIQLSYLMQAGERNRGLSIVKSRGTAHSNQLRELILSDEGVTLADIYSAGGEVLMGTMRWEKESAEREAHETASVLATLKHVNLDAEEAELEVRLKAIQVALEAKRVEQALLATTIQSRKGDLSRGRTRIKELRGADAIKPERKARKP
ncbi:circadian clock protein KaiC [Thermomonas sp.]|uniref:circadian clock protein KaiC n=1 Tax=Thermomonas sp. TaxID=1971895 RepID=UPI0024886BB6|nr:circadian clock protein KaiC [Thermomonas sp.]MDI1251668.1 circadian clock protein KaiC [Thermomonas sp.]